MARLTIDEVIEHCNRHIERTEKHYLKEDLENYPVDNNDFIKRYLEHRQTAEWLMELKKYKKLDEQGLLLLLPCKVGDTVYRINPYAIEPIISMKVLQIRFCELYVGNSFLRIDAINDEDMGEFCYFKNDIGKTVFLTKEEAEAALKEMEK